MSARLVDGGTWIDRTEPIRFSFEGRSYQGFAGDTIASALVANDRWLLSRSFKYHRPRGPLSMAGHEANTLVQLPDTPNVAADLAPIAPGLAVTGQNYSGSLDRDRRQLLGAVGGFLPVGFYYRAFYRPRGAWKFWQPVIRELAGLGKVDRDARHGYYDKQYLHADVAVIGGGLAGMTAALQAAEAGLEVILIEENPRLGGALAYARPAAGAPACDELVAAIEAAANITVLTGAACTGRFADNWLAVVRGNRLYKLRAGQVIVATGSIEQPMVFRNNDLPGILLGSAAARLIRLYGIKPGTRAVVATANGYGYGVALDLAEAGVEVAAVADLRAEPPAGGDADRVRDLGIRVLAGHTAAEAEGRDRLARVVISEITGTGQCAPRGTAIDCDLLCQSVGYAPAAALLCHGGARLGYDPESAMLVAPTDPGAGPHCGRLDRRRLCARRGAGASAARRLAGGARTRWPGRRRTGGAGRSRRPRRQPPVADLPTPEGPRLRRFRRGSAGQGHPERDRRRIPGDRVGQALLHRRHGAEPGPAFGARHRPADGASDRPAGRRGRHHDLPPAGTAGAVRRAGRADLQPGTADADAPRPHRTRRPDDSRRTLVAARLLWRGERPPGIDRGRGAGGPPERRADRRLDARWPGGARARRGRIPQSNVHLRLSETAGRPRPVCLDG